ncbi:MAG: DUF192 domain-containing protein [Candidatus Woesearchaeota archaeon]
MLKIINKLKDIKLKVEIADDASSREEGLMFRKSIPEDEGMLFIFDYPQYLTFWGRNTFIPLDIAFIKNNKIINIDDIKPLSTKGIKSYKKCDMAIETNMGFFENNKIVIGDTIEFNRNNKNDNFVIFKRRNV